MNTLKVVLVGAWLIAMPELLGQFHMRPDPRNPGAYFIDGPPEIKPSRAPNIPELSDEDRMIDELTIRYPERFQPETFGPNAKPRRYRPIEDQWAIDQYHLDMAKKKAEVDLIETQNQQLKQQIDASASMRTSQEIINQKCDLLEQIGAAEDKALALEMKLHQTEEMLRGVVFSLIDKIPVNSPDYISRIEEVRKLYPPVFEISEVKVRIANRVEMNRKLVNP